MSASSQYKEARSSRRDSLTGSEQNEGATLPAPLSRRWMPSAGLYLRIRNLHQKLLNGLSIPVLAGGLLTDAYLSFCMHFNSCHALKLHR